MDPAIVLRTVVLMLVAYLAGSIPVGVLVARLLGRARPADDRLRADRRHERAAGAGPRAGPRSWSSATCSRARCRSCSRAIVTGDPLVEVLCGVRGGGRRDLVASSPGSGAAAASGRASGRCSSSSRRRAPRDAGVHRGDPADALRVARVAARVGGDVPGDAAASCWSCPETPLPYVIYSAVGAALIWLAHADNIDRLLHGTERKFDLGLLAGKTPEAAS